MKCENCGIPLKPYYTFCPNCGSGLRTRPRRFSALMVMAMLVFALALSIGYLNMQRTGGVDFSFLQDTDLSGADHKINNPGERSQFTRTLFPFLKTGPPVVPVAAGQVLLSDIAGNRIAKITTAVSASGWVAVPVQATVGARDWSFQGADGTAFEITDGILGDQDEMGLWQIKNDPAFRGPPLFPAQPDAPMTWMSLVSDQVMILSHPEIQSEQMNVLLLSLPASIKEPGVFIQEGRLVGWTFGRVMEGGFLWKGPDEENLVVELSVDDFYRLTFEGGREEQMTVAYAMDDDSPVARLSAFAGGFRLAPMLPAEKTPPHLRTGVLVKEVRSILAQITDAGDRAVASKIFDGPALAGTGDVQFMLEVLTLMAEAEGPDHPVAVMDDMLMAPLALTSDEIRQLQEFRNGLNRKIQKNSKDKVIIRFSPGSGQIRASGVLNNRQNQNFVVDTGASVVTIPSATAKALGIDSRSAPRRKVITAGGVIEAPEVVLDAIQLDGWIEYDVTAYIVDLPNQNGLGLLGLNYLNRFRMDVNHESGELTLEPR